MPNYGVISGPYFPVFGLNTEIYGVISVFSPNTGKYGPETTPYLDTISRSVWTTASVVTTNNLEKVVKE